MSRHLKSFPLFIAAALFAHSAWAFQVGWRQVSIAGPGPQALATTVALYYPTSAAARAIPMGPFTPMVAINGVPESTVKGLIVLSHGTGGSELGHSRLAEGLAEHGYLVAALRHPRDNWQDHSLYNDGAGAYFSTPTGWRRTCLPPNCIGCPMPGTLRSSTSPACPFPHRTVTSAMTRRGLIGRAS